MPIGDCSIDVTVSCSTTLHLSNKLWTSSVKNNHNGFNHWIDMWFQLLHHSHTNITWHDITWHHVTYANWYIVTRVTNAYTYIYILYQHIIINNKRILQDERLMVLLTIGYTKVPKPSTTSSTCLNRPKKINNKIIITTVTCVCLWAYLCKFQCQLGMHMVIENYKKYAFELIKA